jgi:hypothetical protein
MSILLFGINIFSKHLNESRDITSYPIYQGRRKDYAKFESQGTYDLSICYTLVILFFYTDFKRYSSNDLS